MLLARATRTPLSKLLAERITGPLGMASTGFGTRDVGRLATAYRPGPEGLEVLDPPIDASRAAQQHGWRRSAPTRGLATLLWSVVHGYAHLEAERGKLEISRHQLIDLFDPRLAATS